MFFHPYVPRRSWAPSSLSDREWEREHQVRCWLWRLRFNGQRLEREQLLAMPGRLLWDEQPLYGIAGPIAVWWQGDAENVQEIQLIRARIVKQTPRLIQISGMQYGISDRVWPQTWFAALDLDEGHAAMGRMK